MEQRVSFMCALRLLVSLDIHEFSFRAVELCLSVPIVWKRRNTLRRGNWLLMGLMFSCIHQGVSAAKNPVKKQCLTLALHSVCCSNGDTLMRMPFCGEVKFFDNNDCFSRLEWDGAFGSLEKLPVCSLVFQIDFKSLMPGYLRRLSCCVHYGLLHEKLK